MLGAIVREIGAGSYLDRARVNRIAAVFFALSLIALGGLLLTSNNGVDYRCRPISADYFAFWSAAQVAGEAGPAAAYDHLLNREFQLAYPGNCSEFFLPFWSPPNFLLLIGLFGPLPYLASWIAFSGLSFAAYTTATLKLMKRSALLPIIAAPGAWFNFLIGQIGLILTALFAAALYFLDKRPLLAGAVFGLVAIKPQYGVLIPVFLIALGRWRAFAAAAASVVVQMAAASMILGWDAWAAFFKNGKVAKALLVDSEAIAWEKNISVYAAIRNWGGGAELAYIAHGAFALAVLVLAIRFWRSRNDMRLKAAALPAASLIMSPYSLDYDLILLAPAIALFVDYALTTRFRPYEKTFLLVAWFAPVIAYPIALGVKIPFGLLVTASMLAIILRRTEFK